MRFFVTTTAGLEDITAREVEKIAKVKNIELDYGKVFFEGKENDIYKINYLSRTASKLYILLAKERFSNLDHIYHIAKEIDYPNYIAPHQSFAVRVKRFGTHNFTSVDVGKVVGQAVIDSFLASKKERLKVNLNEPDVEIKALVRNDEIIIGINTTGDGLHKRGYRVYQHPAPLKPNLASALIYFSKWNEKEVMLDPMCGSATILIESALIAKNIPAGYFRKNYAFEKFFFLDIGEFDEIRKKENSKIKEDVETKLLGCDLFKKHVKGSKINATNATVGKNIILMVGDATKIKVKSVDVIVSNPPYGLRIASKKVTEKLYKDFVENLKEIRPKKMAIIIGNRKLQKLIPDNITEEREIMYGDLKSWMVRWEF